MWDVPLEIVGSGGEDKGQGGRYLILPPDFKGNVPAGYFPVRQQTYGGFLAVAHDSEERFAGRPERGHRAAQEDPHVSVVQDRNPPAQRFIDVSGKLWDGYPRIDASFYPVLAKMVNQEPVLPRDLAMMNILRSIGIEK